MVWLLHPFSEDVNTDKGFSHSRDAEGVEVKQPGEEEKIKEVSDQFNRFQMMNFNEHHHCLRGTHLKTQGVCQLCELLAKHRL